jgi:hypothetical protein
MYISWLHGIFFDPEDGVNTFFSITGKIAQDLTVSHPKRARKILANIPVPTKNVSTIRKPLLPSWGSVV